MTQNVDSGQKDQGGVAANNSNGSNGVQPNSALSDSDVDQIVNRLLAHPKYVADKQSMKDRRIADMERTLNDQQKRIAEMMQQRGVAKDAAVEIVADRDFQAQFANSVQAPAQPAVDPVKSVLEELGLKDDDPDVLTIKQKGLSPEAAELELYRLTNRRKKPTNPAAVVAPQGRPTNNGDLSMQYQRELAGLPTGSLGHMARVQLKIKYRGMGYDPDAS